MTPYKFMFAILAFLGFVAVMPALMYFAQDHPAISSLSMEAKFIAGLTPPSMVLLYLVSWLQPRGG